MRNIDVESTEPVAPERSVIYLPRVLMDLSLNRNPHWEILEPQFPWREAQNSGSKRPSHCLCYLPARWGNQGSKRRQ